jgi:aryl-alcohol dehydrogenase-like predicted oxidoreductase
MRYRLLGKSGLRVAEICLGTMTFGEDWGWGSSKDEARKMYDAYREAGGNFIDTANLYTMGTSEKFLGEFMKPHRGEVVLATKYTNSIPGRDPNAGGNQRKNMMQAIEASLKRLGTDYIDLYWLHIWDQITPVDEVMRGFDDLVRAGKVLYAGVSDAPAWWISQANTLADLRGWTRFVALQIEYSLVERTVERELSPMAKALGLTITAWSPLAGGVLSGKYHGGSQEKDSRYSSDMMKAFQVKGERIEKIIAAVKQVSQQVGRSAAQVSIAWLLHRDQPVIPIVGTRKMSQLQDNLAALELKLSAAQVRILDEASAIPLGFPHEFYAMDMVKGFVYGGMGDRIVR